jgi:hypothetical protein
MSTLTVTPAESGAVVSMGFGNLQSYEFMQRTAKMFSVSTMVPTAYRATIQKGYGQNIAFEDNPAAIPNCMIALNMSQRMNADPLMIMQNLHVIEGRPSWSSQYIIASINSCGRYAPLRFHRTKGAPVEATYTTFEWENRQKKAVTTKATVNNDKCIAWTVERGVAIPSFTHEDIKKFGSIYQCCKEYGVPLLESTEVSMEMAVNEGWYGKNGSKWQTMPDLMLQYRSAAFFGRIYAPELLMGLPAVEEVQDTIELKAGADGTYGVPDAAAAEPLKDPLPKSKSTNAPMAEPVTDAPEKPKNQAQAHADIAQAATNNVAPAATKTAAAQADQGTGELPGIATITASQAKYLDNKIKALELPESAVDAMKTRFGVKELAALNIEQFDTLKSELLAQGA